MYIVEFLNFLAKLKEDNIPYEFTQTEEGYKITWAGSLIGKRRCYKAVADNTASYKPI